METKITFIVFLGVGIFYIFLGTYFIQRSRKAAFWPKISATVRNCEIIEDHDEGPVFQTNLCYSYLINNIEYVSYQIYHGYSATGSYEPHKAIYEYLKDAQTIEVIYNPAKLSDSVITYGLSRQNLGFIVIGALSIINTGAGALYYYFPDFFDNPVFWCAICLIFLSGILGYIKLQASVEDNIIRQIKILEKKNK